MIQLRPATPDDIPILRAWDSQPHVIASDPNDDWQWETDLGKIHPGRQQLLAELDGRPIGYLEILDPVTDPEQYWGQLARGHRAIDIWIGEPDLLGKGYGTQMMEQAIDRCFLDPTVHTILIDPLASNTRAHRFYERLGFRFVAAQRFGLDDCHVYRLTRPAYAGKHRSWLGSSHTI